MEVIAKLNGLRMSPRKVRLVANLIRRMYVKNAQNQLQFLNKAAARPIMKLLNSAIANAENNFKLNSDQLWISHITVDEGMTIKRWRPRAHGRAAPIRKRTSKITIKLSNESRPVQKTKREYIPRASKKVKVSATAKKTETVSNNK